MADYDSWKLQGPEYEEICNSCGEPMRRDWDGELLWCPVCDDDVCPGEDDDEPPISV